MKTRDHGYTLIEVVVALLLLSLTAVAAIESLLHSQRAQIVSARWMAAVMVAQQALERARLEPGSGSEVAGRFRIEWTSTPAGAALDLRQIDVVVEWDGPPVQRFTLATLVRR